jgi:hypothetical protein
MKKESSVEGRGLCGFVISDHYGNAATTLNNTTTTKQRTPRGNATTA